MSFHVMTDLGPPRIHSVVAARSAALKIKELSSSLLLEQKKKRDEGDFEVTFFDDPATIPAVQLTSLQPKLEEPQRRRRSTITNPSFIGGYEQTLERTESYNTNRFLEPGGEGHRRRRSSTMISSGFNENLSDTESINVPQSRQENATPRRRRYTIAKARRPSTTTQSSGQEHLPEQGLQNSFRMEPEKIFEHWKVTEIIKKTFEEHLTEEHYDRENCHRMCKILADVIKEQVKSLQFSRYKIISTVSIGQKRGQSVRMVSRSVWDPSFDSYAQYSFEKGDMYAIGVVYGVYCE